MSMHKIVTIPFIELLDKCFKVQMWYADDGKAVGSLDNLKKKLKAQQIFILDKVEIVYRCSVLGSVIVSDNAEKEICRKIAKNSRNRC